MTIKNGTYFSIHSSNRLQQEKIVKIDATGQPIGRIASKAAKILLGKCDYSYDPSRCSKILVIIENANQAIFTGNKENTVVYRSHSGRPGGQRILSYWQIKKRNPKRIFEQAIKGMLPKNRIGRKLFHNLRITLSTSTNL